MLGLLNTINCGYLLVQYTKINNDPAIEKKKKKTQIFKYKKY